ncbi:MAG: hypothetical protein M1822_007496 [Bathelium mastoideum]|nr:MAG: hypothetical protein M1822_007496 [Bathelium mastoideum]
MGGTKPWPEVPVGNKDHTSAAVVIVGAGISGMCAAIDLIKHNKCHNFIILEKSSGVGVWSLLYSFSFEQKSDWTREYPGQEEILEYLADTARNHNLYKHIRFNTSVDEARWDDTEQKWKTLVSVSGVKDSEFCSNYTLTSDFLISAVGQLNEPRYPEITGLESFAGKAMHSARWDWSYSLESKRIAIIGSGATAAQIIPEIAKSAKCLTVYQRSPNWVIPRHDRRVTSFERNLFRYLPFARWKKRAWQMDFRETFFHAVTNSKSAFAEQMRIWNHDKIHAELKDKPELWDVLAPKFHPGCKRSVLSDDYYPTLALPHVRLETRPISRITPTGIEVTKDSFAYPASFDHGFPTEEEYDVLILATGFRTVEFLHPIRVTGTHGQALSELWKPGAHALYGVTVPSLPNFGMLYGPNTNLGHNSIIVMIEAQSRYINALLNPVLSARRQGKMLTIAPKDHVSRQYNERIQEELNGSSFADPNCTSWYKNAEGRITNNWCGNAIDYQKLLSVVKWDDYELGGEGAEVERRNNGKTTRLGRVMEETRVPDALWMGLSALGIAALVGAVAIRLPRLKMR